MGRMRPPPRIDSNAASKLMRKELLNDFADTDALRQTISAPRAVTNEQLQ